MTSVPTPPPPAGRGRIAWGCLGFAALLAGAFLRLQQLRSQVLIDDEWHAVRKLIASDAHGIATHFGYADYCIPLTLFYRWLYDLGLLDEWRMHLPSLIAGIALPVVAPLLARRVAGLPARMLWSGLLAVSPVLVYFSRTARPYALLALLGVIAIFAFHEWSRERSRGSRRHGWAAVYVVATFLAGWLHLLSLVFTLWPFAYFGLRALRDCLRPATRGEGLAQLGRLCLLGIAVVLPLAVALAPPLTNDWTSMAAKAGTNSATPESLWRSLLMAFGLSNAWLCLGLLAAAVAGTVRLARRAPDFTAMVVGMIVVGVLVIVLARPAWVQHQGVLVRYCTIALPFLLLFVAEGLAALAGFARGAAPLAALGLVAVLFVAGPARGWLRAPNQFLGDAIFQFDYDDAHNPYATLLELGPVPSFYRDLAQSPPAGLTLIETPASFNSNFTPGPWLQAIHRQKLKFALASPVCGEGDWDEISHRATGTRFRTLVRLADILGGADFGADYLVLRLHPWTLPPGIERPWPDMAACSATVEARLGAPVFRDEQIVVFALRRAAAAR